MKILVIRGANLASLEGEFEIDFTAEPLKSAGIFAITGSTGAGKSTILDALCLALFDDTPRTNRAKENIAIPDVKEKTINQKDSRTVLRRGMGEGYAEVDFISLGGEKFRSRWMVKRARGKADGSMQNSEIRLVNLSTGVEQQGRKTELLAKIVELIGLTFDQFTRSVLLAQGDFATFLKARQAEKAELLEKLTGTEIYSRISMTIYEKSKQAEQKYNMLLSRINDIELLSEEQQTELTAERLSIVAELKELKGKIEIITEKIKWIAGKEVIKNGILQAEEQMFVLQRQLNEASGRYSYLQQIEQVQEVRDVFNEWKQTTRLIADKQQLLKQQIVDSETNAGVLKQTEQLLEKCSEELQGFNEKVAQIEPQIVQARELDIRITGVQNNWSEVQKEYTAVVISKEKQEQSILSHKKEMVAVSEAISRIGRWFEENRIYETLVPRSELLCALLDDMQAVRQQIEENSRMLADSINIRSQEQISMSEMQSESDRLQRLLPAEIMEWRTRLEEGKPCPVCGSLHHPLTQVALEQSLQEEELEKAKKFVAGEIISLSLKLEQRQNEITRLNTLIGNYQKHAEQVSEKIKTYLSVLPGWEELLEDKNWPGRLKNISLQWITYTNEQIQLKEQFTQLQTILGMEQKNILEAEKLIHEKAARQTTLFSELEHLRQERAALLKGKTVEQVVRACTEKRKLFEEQLKMRTDARNAQAARQEGYRATIVQMERDITLLSEGRELQKINISRWLEKQEKVVDWETLSELLSKDIHWVQNEKRFLNSLKEQETSIKATLEERKNNWLRHQEAEIKPQDGLENQEILQAELSEKDNFMQQKVARQAEIDLLFLNHQKGKDKIMAFEKELRERECVATSWKKLNELFGSASGSKFKEIAQGYTLDVLLGYANRHLKNLSERYELQRIPDTLALQVVDLDMLGESRAVHSLSGGESFLISLALALGLASLSSNHMKVESLFIDEGFGSLDMDTLRIALDALERLQTQGRKIGVISHVTEMTERITAQIQVLKSSNGKSEVRVVG